MCHLNYNTKKEKYKHLTYAERTMIERWYNKENKSKKEIAELLNKSERTIRREINRGMVKLRGYNWEDIYEYSAKIVQDRYEYNKTAKGPQMILDDKPELIDHIESEIKENKKSPEVIVAQLDEKGYKVQISAKTIRNGIKAGTLFSITEDNLTYKKKYSAIKNKEKRVSKMIPAEKSIEYRPKEANNRSVYGHWEGDLVVGKLGTKTVLFTLTERKTRQEIIRKLSNKKTATIARELDKIERKYGGKFSETFKTITFDNGVEFMGYEGIEKSVRNKKKRTEVYYAHPYCSGERGTNENNNRMIRRWIKKGTDIKEVTKKEIQWIEDWLNDYPREMFDYKSSNMVLLEK